MQVGLINRHRKKCDLEDYVRIPFKSKHSRRVARKYIKKKSDKAFIKDYIKTICH